MICLLAVVTSLCACNAQEEVEETLSEQELASTCKVAMGYADITPSQDVYLQGYEEASPNTLAINPTDFTSDLRARILIIDNGTDRLVFLNLEIISSSAEYGDHNVSVELMDAIATLCDTKRENVLLSNVHSHQSYMNLTFPEEQRIVDAVKEAYMRLTPAKVGVSQVYTHYGVSRGSDYTIEETAPYDSLMNVIRFEDAVTGQPIGMVYSVPIHNTMLGNGTNINHNQLSCEFTGYASRAVESAMEEQNPNFTAMHINGFYGNSGPYTDGKFRAGTVEKLQENGAAFGQELLTAFESAKMGVATGEIKTDFVQGSIPAHATNKYYKSLFGDLEEMPLTVTLGAFGDIAYVGVNYEPYSIIGARLKAESPYKTLIPAGIVNGWKGYIPTKEAVELHESGAYQAECAPNKTPFDANGEESFYGQVLDAVCGMAQVSLKRVPMKAAAVKEKRNTAVYTFTSDEAAALDKLVISFGQELRTDCAMDFEVEACDKNDKVVWNKEYTGNSVNYLGEFLAGAEVASVKLTVSTRFGSDMTPVTDGIDQLPIEIWGIQFTNQ